MVGTFFTCSVDFCREWERQRQREKERKGDRDRETCKERETCREREREREGEGNRGQGREERSYYSESIPHHLAFH
jgi:hypothetical protein